MIRIGHGLDVHRFGGQGPIVLGGVRIPFEQGLLAHSDGDVLLHAVCDALLGAAALGDIGHHFPDTDQKYKGIDSRILLREVANAIAQKGYIVANLDTTIVAQAPKMAQHISAMRCHMAEDLKTSVENINVKATTTERLGFTGRGEGIACFAVVILLHQHQTNH